LPAGVKRTLWPCPSDPPVKLQRTVSPAFTVAKTGLKASPTVKMSTVWLVDGLESGEVEQATVVVTKMSPAAATRRTTRRTGMDDTRREGR